MKQELRHWWRRWGSVLIFAFLGHYPAQQGLAQVKPAEVKQPDVKQKDEKGSVKNFCPMRYVDEKKEIRDLDRVGKENQTCAEIFRLGMTMYLNQGYKNALEQFKKAYETCKMPILFKYIGRAYVMLNDYENGLDYFIKYGLEDKAYEGADLEITFFILRYMESNAIIPAEQFARIEDQLVQAKLCPQFQGLWVLKATTSTKQGKLRPSRKIWQEYKSYMAEKCLLGPVARWLMGKGTEKLKAGNKNRARRFFKIAFWLYPRVGDSVAWEYVAIGKSLAAKNEVPEAISNYQIGLLYARSPGLKQYIWELIRALKSPPKVPPKVIVKVEKVIQKTTCQKGLAWGLIGGGSVLLLTSFIFGGMAADADKESTTAYDNYKKAITQIDVDKYYSDYDWSSRNHKNFTIIASVFGTIGVVALVTGIVVLFLPERYFTKTTLRILREGRIAFKPIGNIRTQTTGGLLEIRF